MGKIRRKFDIAFKTQVCQQIEAGVLRLTEFCHDNQIQRTVVEGWLQRYVAGTLVAKASNREKELEREVEKLKAKVGELTMTIDLLKKVEAFKRQQTNAGSSIITAKNLAQYHKPAKPLALPPPATITSPRRTR